MQHFCLKHFCLETKVSVAYARSYFFLLQENHEIVVESKVTYYT